MQYPCIVVTALVVVAISAVCAPADSRRSPHWRTCTGESDVDWQQQIKSCGAVIQGGQETTKWLAFAYYCRGIAYWNMGDYDKAIADYDKAVGLLPRFSEAYYNRGSSYEMKGDKQRALADYRQALAIDGSDQYAKEGLARLSGDPDDSQTTTDDVGTCLTGSGKTAIADCNRAIASGTHKGHDLFVLYFSRGVMYVEKREYDRAIADLDQAIKLDANSAVALHFRGTAKLSRGDRAGGNADIARAKAIDPKIGN